MIATVTLNTAVDKLYLVDQMQPYMVQRVGTCISTPGGKGLNVARVVRKTGEEVLAAGFAGGYSGGFIRKALLDQGIGVRLTESDGESRTCINIREKATGRHTEYLEPGPQISGEALARFRRDYDSLLDESDILVLSGSAPSGVPCELYGEMVRRARERGKLVLLDTSGPCLQKGLEAGPTMIKPNSDEISQLLGFSPSLRELPGAMKKLSRKGIPLVAVSLGKEGVLVLHENVLYHGVPPQIETVNTVGCGDSMMAGFAVGFQRKLPVPEIIRLAVAISAASACALMTGDYAQEDFDRIYPHVLVNQQKLDGQY